MSGKPVYHAGQGFQSTDEGPRRGAAAWTLAALLLALVALAVWRWLGEEPPSSRLRVESDPPGAAVLVNLLPVGLATPCDVELPAGVPALVQVSLAGHEAEPLALRLDPAGPAFPRRLHFHLRPLPDAATADPGAATPAAAPLPSPARGEVPAVAGVGLASLLEGSLRHSPPAGNSNPASEGHEIVWNRWDEAFRLRVDGRALPVAAARVLAAGPRGVRVDLNGRALLDTLLAETGRHLLTLPGPEAFVEVRVRPGEAEITEGDATRGRGRCLLHRSELPLTLRFPALPGLLPPPPLAVAAGAPRLLEAVHRAPLRLSWTPAAAEGIRLEESGYVLPPQGFIADATHGPRLADGSAWLGRAFLDRRPGGDQALRLVFDLDVVNAEWPAELELAARDSGQRFPLVLTRGATLTVLLNGTPLARDMPLALGEDRRAWPVASLLRAGRNVVQLQCGETSRSRGLLIRLELRVGP